MQQFNETTETHITATIELAAAYLSNNAVSQNDIGSVISSIHTSLATILNPSQPEVVVETPELVPAVSIKKSITADYIVCLEDGKKMKSLKRHLRTSFNLTPEEYRARWGLAADYPMVAPNYAAKRSELAKASGLGVGGGRKRKVDAVEAFDAVETAVEVEAKAPRARKAKVVSQVETEVEAFVAE